MTMQKVVGVLVGVVLLAGASGCALAQQRRAAEMAQRDLVGLSRDSLLECAGNPVKALEAGERETFIYVSENPLSESPKRRSTCVANFTLHRGYVEYLHYETLAGRIVTEREACLPIVEGCLSAIN